MKRRRTSADLGLCKSFKTDQKRCVLMVICTTGIAALSLLFTAAYLVILLSETTRTADAQSPPGKPRPFEAAPTTPAGETPRRFRPTFATVTPTTEKTTAGYPQHYYPRSVQEVIDYVTDKPTARKFADLGMYKPEDPGEVNLMATGRVRFAHPPVWKSRWKKFNGFTRRPIPVRGYFNASGMSRSPRLIALPGNTDLLATVKKPVMVSINIVPMEDSTKMDAMTLNLKVYPDMTHFNENQSK